MFYSTEALWLLDEGYAIEDIDRALKGWGMPLGPIALTDDVGLDVAVKVAHILSEAFGDRLPSPGWLDKAGAPDRLGTKTGLGFYKYDGRRRQEPDREIYRLLGLNPRVEDPDPTRIADRLVLPMVNEAARCLEEGVVRGPGDIDLAMIMGTGFPPFRGGLCRWADQQGLSVVIGMLEELAEAVGPRHQPSDALRAAAASGGFYAHTWPGLQSRR
jgi:3-hydroxyacyl-CoA dehydrogenase/enoyl-CoA hydratase/3-hydroxybutyryl-CoA epimerase